LIAGRQGVAELNNVVEALLYLEQSSHGVPRDGSDNAVDDVADVLIESGCSA
jgi:hypothetical protein